MRKTAMHRSMVSAIVIMFFMSTCLLGCSPKSKKEQATPPAAPATTSTTTSSAPENMKIPEPPGEPVVEVGSVPEAENAQQQALAQQQGAAQQQGPGQQQEPFQQPEAPQEPQQEEPYQQPSGGNIAVNIFPTGTGFAPWWNQWGGGTLAPATGSQPPPPWGNNPPPSVSSGGIVVYNVGFIPDGAVGYVNETTVGQRGALYGFFANKYPTAQNLRGRISVDGNIAKDETVPVVAETNNGFTVYPYAFDAEGSHSLWFGIDAVTPEDQTRNTTTSTIMVRPAAPVGGGGGGQAGAETKDVVAVSVGFKLNGANGWAQSVQAGQQGMLQGYIDNRFSTAINVDVIIGYFDTLVQQGTVSVGPGARSLYEAPFAFPSPGSYFPVLIVNRNNTVQEEGQGVADNNMAASQLTVTGTEALPNLSWKLLPYIETTEAGRQTTIQGNSTHVKVDQLIKLNDTVINVGGAPSGSCIVWPKFPDLNNVVTYHNTGCPIGTIQPGQGQLGSSCSFSYLQPGEYKVDLVIDRDNMVQESTKDDNTIGFNITVDPLSPEDANKPNMKAMLLVIWNMDELHIASTVTGQPIKIFATVRNTGPVRIDNARVVIRDLNVQDSAHQAGQVIYDELVTLAPGGTKDFKINHTFTTPGEHEIEVRIDPNGTTIPNERTRDDNAANDNIQVGLAQTQGPGPGPLQLAQPKPDAKAIDIGFIPNGERSYFDVVTAGRKGSIYAVFDNIAQKDIRNLRVQVLVDGHVLRDSVKTSLARGERGSISVNNYWFNEGQHKMSLILDPNNEIVEIDKNNNRVGHTITAVRRQGSARRTYDSAASTQALSGLMGAFGGMADYHNDGGGGQTNPPPIYNPPPTTGTSGSTPRPVIYTPSGWDGGRSGSNGSTGTSTKKTTPVKVKGLGR